MEIKNTLNPLDPYSRTSLAGTKNETTPRTAQAATAAQGETGDRISLSPEAKLRTEAFTSAMNAPDLRTEKVAAIKARVDSGEYAPDSKVIAAKLLAGEPGLFRP